MFAGSIFIYMTRMVDATIGTRASPESRPSPTSPGAHRQPSVPPMAFA
jgi:hypothetical protein